MCEVPQLTISEGSGPTALIAWSGFYYTLIDAKIHPYQTALSTRMWDEQVRYD